MSTIYLVRHGQACFGTANYDQLSDTGRDQVRLLGGYFAQSGERIDRIYSGALNRQCETADLIAQAVGIPGATVAVQPAFDEYDGDIILREFAASLPQHE